MKKEMVLSESNDNEIYDSGNSSVLKLCVLVRHKAVWLPVPEPCGPYYPPQPEIECELCAPAVHVWVASLPLHYTQEILGMWIHIVCLELLKFLLVEFWQQNFFCGAPLHVKAEYRPGLVFLKSLVQIHLVLWQKYLNIRENIYNIFMQSHRNSNFTNIIFLIMEIHPGTVNGFRTYNLVLLCKAYVHFRILLADWIDMHWQLTLTCSSPTIKSLQGEQIRAMCPLYRTGARLFAPLARPATCKNGVQ